MSNNHSQNLLIWANLFVLICIIFVLVLVTGKGIISYAQTDPQIISTAQKMAKDCFYHEKESCYEPIFDKLINDHNFSYAEKTLYALQDIDQSTRSCHILAHYMSRQAVRKTPGDWLSLLDSVNVNACGSGFLHGVLEAHLGDDPNTQFDGKLSEQVCDRGNDEYRKRMCTHFMGHFFVVNNNDHVELAVPYCDGVSKSLQFDCLDGLFMEHNQKISLTDHKQVAPPNYNPSYAKSLEDVCFKYSDSKASACWTEMAEVYAKTFGYNADIIHSHCLAGGPKYAENCYGKGQTVLSTYPLDLTATQLTDICKFYNNEYGDKNCIHNLLYSLLYYSPKFTTRGLLLCENIPKYNDWCAGQLGERLGQIVPSANDRLTLCQSANSEKYKKLCAQVN